MDPDDVVKIAKALADPTRYRMFQEIRARGSLTCSQACGCFPLSQPTISHHIKLLVSSGLVSCRKDGPFSILTADEDALARFRAVLGAGGTMPESARQDRAKKTPPSAMRRARSGTPAPRSGGRATRTKR